MFVLLWFVVCVVLSAASAPHLNGAPRDDDDSVSGYSLAASPSKRKKR